MANVDTNINIQDNICWRCGKEFVNGDRTSHHGIPSCLQPVRNVIIPLCKKCHEDLNQVDYSTIQSYVYKVMRDCDDLNKNVMRVGRLLDSISSMQKSLDASIKKKKKR